MNRARICRTYTLCALTLCLVAQSGYALILYSGDNSANQSAPDQDRQNIFDAVARVCDNGGGNTSGSAVYLRGKYLLTANHVRLHNHGSNPTDSITFDGVNYWEQDSSFTPVQISGSDMKLFKLVEDPGLPETPLFTSNSGDVSATATLIGWGRGRDPNVEDSGSGSTNIWQWGNNSTLAKRWGTNQIDASGTGNIAGYTYTYLLTDLDRTAGNNEAGVSLFDSGSGLFINQSGTWKLAGLTAAVSSINGPTEEFPNLPRNSTFDSGTLFNPNDKNYFVRITTYASDIEDEIPDLTTYAGWKIDSGLYGDDANDDADTDGDGIGQILEFALGGDPHASDLSILPTMALTEDSDGTFLELSLTRPDNLQGVDYTPQTTTDVTSWPTGSAGIAPNPATVNHGDGTETITYRREDAVSESDHAFMRVNISIP